MNIFQRTEEFDHWLDGLKDRIAKARILYRIDAAALGNFGECEPVGEGVSEMKINVGPDTGSTTQESERSFICCWLVAINPARSGTSSSP
jgi:putative addiction module killer protein